jgi:hypothetical protein
VPEGEDPTTVAIQVVDDPTPREELVQVTTVTEFAVPTGTVTPGSACSTVIVKMSLLE